MNSPFQFGRTVSGAAFTDRKKYLELLKNNLTSGISTILISPRRWGKSSLVNRCIEDNFADDKKYRIVMLDLFKIRTEQEFFEAYAGNLLKSVSSKPEDIFSHIKTLFKKLTPKITFTADSMSDISLSFDINELSRNRIEVLELAERIAEKKKVKIIFCIDEFQNIDNYDNSEAIQRELRASWQNHKNVVYCVYGSKRHMMRDIFSSAEKPFYKFGDIIFLEKIKNSEWQNFITKSFKQTGKNISPEYALKIADLMKEHPYYVQQLSHLIWTMTENSVTEQVLEDAKNRLIDSNIPFIMNEYESLSNTQINLLKAVCNGEIQLNSTENLQKYRLGTSGNVSKNKKILESKDIIDIRGDKIEFIDPVFEMWFRD